MSLGDRGFRAVTAGWAALRWPVGIAIALYRVTRRIDVHRRTETREGLDPRPADRYVPGDPDAVQPRSAGAGPSSRRRFSVRVREARLSPERLIATLALNPNLASPFEIARFVKTAGRLGELEVGDEYLVRIPGPWDGPVRVAGRTPTSFRLATLHGHMEAGEIEFSAREEGDALIIQIESAARSGSTMSWLVYGPARLGAEMQLHMWVHFLERAARLSGGETSGVEVTTIRYPDDRGRPSRASSTTRAPRGGPTPLPGAELHDGGAPGPRRGGGLAG